MSRIVLPLALLSLAILPASSWPKAAPEKKTVTANRTPAVESQTTPEKPTPSTPAETVVEQKAPAEKSPSVIQMLEGREADLLVGVSIAVVFFAIGWIWGGNYYLRRDRARSRKLRF